MVQHHRPAKPTPSLSIRFLPSVFTATLLAATFAALEAPAQERDPAVYRKDIAFALEALQARCGHFFKLKGIDWKKVSQEIARRAREVKTDSEHLVLLVRLLARLEDGHARVIPVGEGKNVKWPLEDNTPQSGPGMFWCRSGDKILVKNSWSAARDAGIRPGMEIVEVDGKKVEKWLEDAIAERRDLMSFSTDHQAFYAACHWGLADDRGSKMSLVIRTSTGRRGRATLTRRRASTVPVGPVFPPEGLETLGRQSYGKTPSGYGYIHLRDVPGELPAQMDTMLAAIGKVPGLILDCRANGGGGCDHDAVLGRFVPPNQKLRRASAYPIPSAGDHPYGGPMVVIVDAGCRSAGETIAGMFKEDGRGYMIGESPTAGTSSQKTTIELPSGLFSLHVSVRSNKKRFNDGRGIEGIGVIPHETVPYEQEDLAREVDTLIRRAEQILEDFPQDKVPYRPEAHGWKPPED